MLSCVYIITPLKIVDRREIWLMDAVQEADDGERRGYLVVLMVIDGR